MSWTSANALNDIKKLREEEEERRKQATSNKSSNAATSSKSNTKSEVDKSNTRHTSNNESSTKEVWSSANALKDIRKLREQRSETVRKNPTVANPPATVGKSPSGHIKGNIDLSNRPRIKNADGTISTVDTVSYFDERDNKETVVPTVINVGGEWKHVSGDEAWAHYLKTGEHLGKFDTSEEAVVFAQQLHLDEEKKVNRENELIALTTELTEKRNKYTNDYWDNRLNSEMEKFYTQGAESSPNGIPQTSIATEAFRIVDGEKKSWEAEEKELQNKIDDILSEINNYRDANFLDITWNSLKRGYYNAALGTENYKAMSGYENNADEYEKILNDDAYKFETDAWWEKMISGAAEQVGLHGHSLLQPETLNATLGGAAAASGAVALAGQLGPQVALPEEAITVPGAAIIGAKAGFASQSAMNIAKIEGGLAYKELIENGVSEKTASNIALAVGGVNGLIETFQIDELFDAYKILAKRGTTDSALKLILKELERRGLSVAKETAQEIAQEGVTMAGVEAGSRIDKGEGAFTADEVKDRLKETALSSALTFGLMNAPAVAINSMRDIRADGRVRKIGKDYSVDTEAVIQEGLELNPNSEAHKIAEELQAKRDSGKIITNAELGRAVIANEREIRRTESEIEDSADDVSIETQPATLEEAAQAVVNDRESDRMGEISEETKEIGNLSAETEEVENKSIVKPRNVIGEVTDNTKSLLGDGNRTVGFVDGQAYVTNSEDILPSPMNRSVFLSVNNAESAKAELGATESNKTSANIGKILTQSDFTPIRGDFVDGTLENVGEVRVFTDEEGREIALEKDVAEYFEGYNLEATFRGGKPYAIKATDNDGKVAGVAMAVWSDSSGQTYNLVEDNVKTTSNVPFNVMANNNNAEVQSRWMREAANKKATGYGQYGVQAFTSVMENVPEGLSPRVARVFNTAYKAGLTNIDIKRMTFDNDVQRKAFEAGKKDYIMENADKVENVKNVVSRGDKAGFDRTGAPTDTTSEQLDIVDRLCKALGVKGRFVDTLKGNAVLITNQGEMLIARDFERKVKHGDKTRDVSVVYHAVHELAMHRLMELAPVEGQAFINALYRYMEVNGVTGLAEAKRAAYAKQGVDISLSEAMEEVSANAILEFYTYDEAKFAKALDRILNGNDAQAKKGARKFKQILDDIIGKIHKTLDNLGIKKSADLDKLTEIRNLFEKALAKAAEVNKDIAANTTIDENGVVTNSKGEVIAQLNKDGTASFSLKTYDDSGRAELNNWLDDKVKSKALTKAEANDIVEQMEYFYDICKQYEDKYAPFSAWSKAEVVKGLDGKPLMSVVKANGEYKMNLDFSLVCKKRRPLDALYRAMIDDGIMDNIAQLDAVDVARINEIIRSHGLETACTLCFVDAKRYRQFAVADAFVSKYNELVNMLAPEGVKVDRFDFSGKRAASAEGLHTMTDAELKDGINKLNKVLKEHGAKSVVGRIVRHLKAHPNDRKLVSHSDFMDSTGFTRVSQANPKVFKLYNSSKGSGGPKATLPDVQYLGEILKKSNFTPERAYAVGGVRVQSFSDYIPRLVFDYLQMTADLTAKKLPAHAYSKEDIFVMQFGKTGIKINMSLVPAVAKDGVAPGLDKDGNYVWVDGHTFASNFHDKGSGQRGFELAIKIQNTEGYGQNCGTVAVGVSNEHIEKMLKDDNIRMVIPYHKSGLNHLVAQMGNIDQYHDYTNVQNTRYKSGENAGKKITGKDFNFNEAFHRLGDAKAATEEYLAWCDKNDYLPKFDYFAYHEDAAVRENYYKTLIDFAAYDSNGKATPQGAVQMNFPTEGDAFGSMKTLIEKGLEADAILEGKKTGKIPEILKEVKAVLGVEKAQKNTDLTDGVRYSVKENCITADMSDADRAKILTSKSILAPVYKGQSDAAIESNSAKLNSGRLGLVKQAIVAIGEQFGVVDEDIQIKDVDVEIRLSKSNLRESVSKKATPAELAKLIPILKESVGNAIGIERHDNRYYYDSSTVYFENLLGGYADGEYFIPIRFGLKHINNGKTTLYIVVDQNKIPLKSLDKIKKTEVIKASGPQNAVQNTSRSVNYKISQIIPFVKNKDVLRYIPDDMLTTEQKTAKWEAIAETIQYTADKNDAKYAEFIRKGNVRAASEMVKRAALAHGYTVNAYHGTGADFNIFTEESIGKRNVWGKGFYFGTSKGIANDYASWRESKGGKYRIISAYLKMDNPYIHRESSLGTAEEILDRWFPNRWKAARDLGIGYIQGKLDSSPLDLLQYIAEDNNMQIRDVLREYDYDSIKDGGELVVFNSNQIKSADPVTYDDDGNVIPLSERFNESNNDIRYSLRNQNDVSLKDVANIKKAVAKKNADVLLKYVDSGVISTEAYEQLIEEFGAISKGENPHRDVRVPQKTAKDKKVSQTVRTILEAKATPDEAVPTIEKMVEDGIFSYDVYTDKQAINDAESYIKEYGWDESLDDWFDAVNKGEVSKEITTMGWALYNNAANTAATTTSETERTSAIKTSLKILDAMVKHQRSAAQALQATRILKKLSPETQLYGIQKSVSALQNEMSERYGDKAPDLKIDEGLAEDFLNAKTPEERAEIEKEILKDIGRQMPSRFIDKWNAWRYLAMLGNVRTHIKNIGGNAGFAPIVALKNLTANAIEASVHFVSGKKTIRSKAFVGLGKADRALLKAAWNDYANVADLISNGGKYNDSAMANQYIEEGRQIFKFKPLEWARKGNSKALEYEDMWFSMPHYASALAQYCKANNITAEQLKKGKALGSAREYAIKEAQKATYRDTNAFSQMVSSWGRSNKNEKNVAKKAFNTVVEGILPFRKTPANILVRGIEYSPLGLLKGLSYDLYQVGKGKMTSAEAIDNVSAGLTGTGLLALGVYLAAQGLVRGHGEDDEEKDFKELMGHQSYALELPNGESVTLDWLAPEALPFFVGVNIYETTKGTDEEVNLSTILQAVSGISEPMLEMSCLQSLNDLFESVGYASSNDTSGLVSVLTSAATSYLTQGLPTLLGQSERTGEENRMTTYTEKNDFLTGDMQYTLGKASAKIPFWDYNQIPYIDAWGRKEASGTALKRGLNNFLNPAYTSTIETSSMERELMRLYERTGESGVFPSRADKYFTVDGNRKDLTAEEYVRYATLKGEKSYKLVSDLVKSKAYKNLSNEEKVKAVKEAYDYANQKAKQTISQYKPESWVSDADKFGKNVGNYLSFKTEVSSTREDNGGKISKQEVVDIALDMAQSDTEIWDMYLSMYDNEKDVYVHNQGVDGEDYMNFILTLDKYDKPTKSGAYGSYTQEEATKAIKNVPGISNRDRAILWKSVNKNWKDKNNPWRNYLP